jgi:hypothetical protein
MESVKNIQKLVDTAKQEAIKLAKDLAEMVAGLKPLGLADIILNNPEFKKSIASLGVASKAKSAATTSPGSKAVVVKKKRTMSKAGRERIAAAAKARWAKAKGEGKTTLS